METDDAGQGSTHRSTSLTEVERAAIAQRIASVRGTRSLSDFARETGLGKSTLQRYEGGERLPGTEELLTLARVGGVSVEWILSGDRGRLEAHQPSAGYVYLPLYDVRAKAGPGHLVENEPVVDVLAFKEDWIRQELRATPDDLKLIYVEGDSMEPDLRAGDIVLLDHTDTLARREGIYVIRMDGALLVKQLQRLPGGVVKLISRNPSYEPFTVPVSKLEEPDGFAIIGRVVWACRRF